MFVQGAEVLTIGTDAWAQVVNDDDARAQGGYQRTAWKEGERQGEGEHSGAESLTLSGCATLACDPEPHRTEITVDMATQALLKSLEDTTQCSRPRLACRTTTATHTTSSNGTLS